MPKRNTRRRLSLSHCRTRCALADRGLAIPHHELRDLAGKLGQDCPTICTQAPSLMPIHPEFAPIPDRANSQKLIPRWPPRRDHHPSLKRAGLPTGAKPWLRRTPVGAELCWSWMPPFFWLNDSRIHLGALRRAASLRRDSQSSHPRQPYLYCTTHGHTKIV